MNGSLDYNSKHGALVAYDHTRNETHAVVSGKGLQALLKKSSMVCYKARVSSANFCHFEVLDQKQRNPGIK